MTTIEISTTPAEVKPIIVVGSSIAELVALPADLVAEARYYHAGLMAKRAACRFEVQSFEDWLADLVRDSVYGPGVDAGAAADWIER